MIAALKEPIIALIVAVAENGVIGNKGTLPWRLSTDLRSFRRLTMGKPVIMGRKTFQSIGVALDGRDNIVVTRDAGFQADGVEVVRSFEAALDVARRCAELRKGDEVMVIGGAEIYRAAMPVAKRVYWTEVHAKPEGDTTMEKLDPRVWKEVSRSEAVQGEKDQYACTFTVFERR